MVAEPLRDSASIEAERSSWWRASLDTLWRLVVTTVSSCLRYRVTGLAAEAAFFAVLSVPPLVFGLAGGIGYVTDRFDPGQVDQMQRAVIDFSSRLLTDKAVDKVIETGQPCPGSVCDHAMKPAARRRWASGSPSACRSQGAAASPWPTARSMSQCHEGWNSTSSTRLP